MEISSPTQMRPLPPRPNMIKTANASISSTTSTVTGSKPRIRILLAPYMSPYVAPLNKVETWELLLDLLEKLFGPSIANPNLRVTDTQGNVIHMHVWEDLLEPGMTIVVDTGSSTIIKPNSTMSGPSPTIQPVYASPRQQQVASPTAKEQFSVEGVRGTAKDLFAALRPSPETSGKLFSFPGKGPEKLDKIPKNKSEKSPKTENSAEGPGWRDGNPTISLPVIVSRQPGIDSQVNNTGAPNHRVEVASEVISTSRLEKGLVVPENTAQDDDDMRSATVSNFAGEVQGGEENGKGMASGDASKNSPIEGVDQKPVDPILIPRSSPPEAMLSPRGETPIQTVAARRKRSAATRVQEALTTLKTRYVHPAGSSAPTVAPRTIGSKNSSPSKVENSNTTTPEDSPSSLKFSESSSGASSPGGVRTYTTLASGAISSQPPKSQRKPRRAKSFRAFFGFSEEAPMPVVMRSFQGMTPIPQEPPRSKSTSPPSVNHPVDNRHKYDGKSGYTSDSAADSGNRSRSGTNGTSDTAVSENNAKVTSITPTAEKPLPKLPYKFSTFPAPTPPRSPLIKVPARPLPSIMSSTPPTPSNVIAVGSTKIVPFSELNRRLAKDSKFKKEGKTAPRSSSTHRRNRSATSQTSAASDPTSATTSSRPSTAITAAELAAISNSGLKARMINVGGGGSTDKPAREGSSSNRVGRSIRRIASDDNISINSAEARKSRVVEAKKSEFKRPKTANEKKVGLGIDMLEIQGGRTIAIGFAPP